MQTITQITSSMCAVTMLAAAAFAQPVIVPDNGSGSADFPPVSGSYTNVGGTWDIINGLPPGSQINMDADLGNFFNVVRNPDGFGGENQQWQGWLFFTASGTGAFSGYNRLINIPVQLGQTHTDPRGGGPVQSFDTTLMGLQGQITGDPDFDLLRVTAGNNFGMPSPGHTTLTQMGPNWNVDSFFDITYRIDFVGRPGGPFSGMSGSTTATVRMEMGVPTPGAAAMLGLGGLASLRRRRR